MDPQCEEACDSSQESWEAMGGFTVGVIATIMLRLPIDWVSADSQPDRGDQHSEPEISCWFGTLKVGRVEIFGTITGGKSRAYWYVQDSEGMDADWLQRMAALNLS